MGLRVADLLFEVGLEEVPARMLASAQDELSGRVWTMLQRERLLGDGAGVQSFSTPRRLAVLVRGVVVQQADAEEEMVGPPVKAAFKDGVATAAAHAFAKKAGVAVESLKTVTTAKGEYLAATVKHAGRLAAEIVAAELPKEIAGIYWAKSMYWRAGKPERFVRPVQWMLALLDDAAVPVEWAGVVAGRVSYGHRVLHGSTPVEVSAPSTYKEALRAAFVLVDVEERRQTIRKALDRVTRAVEGARWREDHALVDKVTHLTEWPSVVMGGFEADFLRLPEEVLVTVMRDHQNYFAPEGGDGKLLPYFLAVLNTEVAEPALGVIRHGNERVLRARFNDARFFYEFDQRVPLVERVALLEKVTFQKELGSYAAKTQRVRRIAAEFGTRVAGLDLAALDEAARLAKTDLTTELVKEFTELQGVVGGLYARAQGMSAAAATAIYDHYLPASMEDGIPRTAEGLVLSIADKADTISGMFGLGLQPTGSKDPFALRRAANGIVKMLAESELPLTLEQIALLMHAPGVSNTQIEVKAFLFERLEWYLRDVRGFSYDSVKAVLATKHTDVRDAVARVEAVSQARNTADFEAVSAAFKRMKNILDQAQAKGDGGLLNFDSQIASGAQLEETTLRREAARVAKEAETFRAQLDYLQALRVIATLRPAVDAFFDKVMVMVPEVEIRAARLGLLQRMLNDFSRIADFSEIVVVG